MPTYTYECKRCTAAFDRVHGMSVNPRVRCTECGGPCRRLLGTGAALIFKGSGFYETDYRKKSGAPDSKADSSAKGDSTPDVKSETKPESKSETKSETKPETKSETKPEPKRAAKAEKAANN